MSPQFNFGGSGLDLSYNTPTWAIISWIITIALILIAFHHKFIYPENHVYFVIFPILCAVSGMTTDISQSTDWFFRQLYLLGGLFFLFSLFQFSLKPRHLDQALYIIAAAALIQALIGTLQINAPHLIPLWLPVYPDHVPRGIFRQINVQASFLATGFATSFYLISRPSFYTASLPAKLLLISSITFSNYIVIASGSRIGLISILLSFFLLLISRKNLFLRHKKTLGIIALTLVTSTYFAQAGLSRTLDKMAIANEKNYSAARLNMYSIGLELITQKPLVGHGIGSFKRIWSQQSAIYLSKHPKAHLPVYVSHPHNELLFWAIEGGITTLTGVFIFIFGIALTLYRCGFQRGGAYAALLLPISIHTQVELPFYISSIHWFLWLFLIYLSLSHFTRTSKITISTTATRILQIFALLIGIGTTFFMVNCFRAQADIYNFMFNPNSPPPHLEVALKNLYLKPVAEQLALRSTLYASIKNNDPKKVKLFTTWAKEYLKENPEPKIFEDLITANRYLNPEKKPCSTIKQAFALHPQYAPFKKANKECTNKAYKG